MFIEVGLTSGSHAWYDRISNIDGLQGEKRTIEDKQNWEVHSFQFTVPCSLSNLNTIIIRASVPTFPPITLNRFLYLDEIELTLVEAPVICYPEFYEPIPNPVFSGQACQDAPFTIFNISNTKQIKLTIGSLAANGSIGVVYSDQIIDFPSKVYVSTNSFPNAILNNTNPTWLAYKATLYNDCYSKDYEGNFSYSNSSLCEESIYQEDMHSVLHSPLPCCITDIVYANESLNIDPHNPSTPMVINAANSITFLENVDINQTLEFTHLVFNAGHVIDIKELTQVGDLDKMRLDFIIQPCSDRIDEEVFNIESNEISSNLQHNNRDIYIFPNPAMNVMHIEYLIRVNELFTINLYDISGRNLKQVHITNEDNKFHTIDISDVVDGIYIVELIHNNEKKYGKLIIQR